MKRAILLALLGVLVTAGGAWAQALSPDIAGGPHDFSAGMARTNTDTAIAGQTCVFCHTPHSGGTGTPLWNRNNTTSTYQVYTSSTIDTTAPDSASIQSSVSGACLSCHDGSIAIDVLVNLNGAAKAASIAFLAGTAPLATYGNSAPGTGNIMTGGIPWLGLDLRNDHPINITYQTAWAAQTPSEFAQHVLVGGKVTVNGGATGALPLYGTTVAAATVECASCHNPHNNTNDNFLRKAATNSQLCLTCHVK